MPIWTIALDVGLGRGHAFAMRHHSRSFTVPFFCCFVGILIAGAQSCLLDENGLQNPAGGADFESTGTSSSSSSSGMPTVCGDLSVDTGEMCDDGNMTPGDRCSPSCTVEQPGICPGTAITLKKGETLTITDSTTDAEDDFIGSRPDVGNCGGDNYPGKDMIYAVTVAADGMLSAELDADFSRSFVHARPGCPASKADDLACEYRWDPGTTKISLMVTANSMYYIAADSWEMRAGTFRLTLSLN